MELLERKTYLDDLSGFLTQASRGHGCMLFLGGEAGVGKSALTQAFQSVGWREGTRTDRRLRPAFHSKAAGAAARYE